MRVCAITNVYNEAFNLPIWLDYYGSQIGIENCIIIDHGSTDGSTLDLKGAGIIRIPRVEFSDHLRAAAISGIANSMLRFYDAVLYCDCDEILVADPQKFANLVEFCAEMDGPATTAIGLNIVHHLRLEDPIEISTPVLKQRRYVQFVSPMCKTLLIKKPVTWGGGFHSSSHPPKFNNLYLFHLRWLDLGECLRRLSITRKVQFSDQIAGKHHRSEYMEFIKIFQQHSDRPIEQEFILDSYIKEFLDGNSFNETKLFSTRKEIRSSNLYALPRYFSEVF
jgi:glycosyltransferase involved in cell wall biosynthesis